MSGTETTPEPPENDWAGTRAGSVPISQCASPVYDLVRPSPGPSHSVQFYDDGAYLTTAVANFLAVALTTGQPVIATAVHCDAFVKRLSADGFDLDAARRTGQVALLDVQEMLSGFMTDGMPDAERFRSTVGGAIERSMNGGRHTSVRLYGEMVDFLWKDGQSDSAIRLEELWNDLGSRYDFSLLCAYSTSNFYKAEDAERFQEICRQHTHVIPAEGYAGVSGEARLVEISRLQQRARAPTPSARASPPTRPTALRARSWRQCLMSYAPH